MRAAARLLLLLALPAAMNLAGADEPVETGFGRFGVDAGLDVFRWREYEAGQRLLAETGTRYRLRASLDSLTGRSRGLVHSVAVSLHGGTVDYDGQDTNGRFVGSRTAYRGGQVDGWLAYRHPVRGGRLAMDVGGGLDWARWERDIRSGRNALGEQVGGFAETYEVATARAGVSLLRPGATGLAQRVAFGLRLPLDVKERVTVRGERIRLAPTRNPAPWAEWELSLAPAAGGQPFGTYLRLHWQQHRFGRSPARQTTRFMVWQPKSRMDELGIAIGRRF